MDCTAAQNFLLSLDSSDEFDADAVPSDIRAHLANCSICQQFVARLRKMEAMVPALPVPLDRSRAAMEILLLRLRAPRTTRPVIYRFFTIRRAAVAAIIFIALGLSIYLLFVADQPAQASSDLVGQLVDWNIDLAKAPNLPERTKLYSQKAAHFRRSLSQHGLSADDLSIANALYDQGTWLSEHDEPFAQANHFCDMAEMIATQSQREASKQNFSASAHWLHEYEKIHHIGVENNLNRLTAQAHTREQKDLVDHLRHRDKVTSTDLAHLAEQPEIRDRLRAYNQQHPLDLIDTPPNSESHPASAPAGN